jgi:predicted flap endonuclease-1-like 5' DNA nuclease
MGAAVAAAAAGVGAAAWAKRRGTDASPRERKIRDSRPDRKEVLSTPSPLPNRGAAVEGDDLTAVKGIGAVISGRLAEAGVTSYRQIAAWDDAGLEATAATIKISPERIRHEDWVGQARRMAGG